MTPSVARTLVIQIAGRPEKFGLTIVQYYPLNLLLPSIIIIIIIIIYSKVQNSGFKEFRFSNNWWFFVWYLDHGIFSRWSGLSGIPDYPSPHLVRMTEGLPHFLSLIIIYCVNVWTLTNMLSFIHLTNYLASGFLLLSWYSKSNYMEVLIVRSWLKHFIIKQMYKYIIRT